MLIAICVASAMALLDEPGGKLLAEYSEPVRGLAWRRNQNALLIFTKHRVRECPSGRSAKLSAHYSSDPPYSQNSYFHLKLNASGTRGIGDGFVLDLRSLKSWPLATPALWIGDELVKIQTNENGRWDFIRSGRRFRVAKGWHVAGVSDDGRFAVVNKTAPFHEVDTWLMKINRRTGSAKRILMFTKSSYDHLYLARVSFNQELGTWLIHANDYATDWVQPYLAGPRLSRVRVGLPISKVENTCHLSWAGPGSPWTLAAREFFDETDNGSLGLDAYTFDLFNVRTKRTVRLAKLINRWSWYPGDPGRTVPDRLSFPVLSAPALDWKTKRFVYSFQTNTSSKVYLISFAKLLRRSWSQ
ncbi:MAG: hypothetical protein ACR2HJ_03895 [Fimbriimonadales bacterium]